MRLFITIFISIFLYGYTPQLSAIALPGASTAGETSATFNASAYLSSDSNFQEKTTFSVNDSITVKFTIVPAVSDRRQFVPIYIVRNYNNQWFMKNEQNNWVPWEFGQRLIRTEMRMLGNQEVITVDSDLTGLAGEFYFYVGYGLPSGDIVSNSQALVFDVEQQNAVDTSIPVLDSLFYAEIAGRVGHQGFRPLQRKPVAGTVYLMITTKGDVASLVAKVTSNSANEQTYTAETPESIIENDSQSFDDDLKEWVIKTEIPAGESSVLITMISSKNQSYLTPIQKFVTSSIELKLLRSDVYFSPGPNTVSALITNHGEDATFLISATDNHQLVQRQFNSQTLTIKKGESQTVDISVNLARNIQRDIFDYQIAVRVENTVLKEVNTAKMDINIVKAPTIVSDKYKSVIINPGSCTPVSKSSQTVEVIIPGSEKLFLDKVDFDSIVWMNGELKPLSSELIDKVSFNNHVCDDIKLDGMIDLVMSFSLQDIINASQDWGSVTHWPAYISFDNTDGFSGDVVRFTMSVGE
jgi:hypothetical protein